VTTFIVHERQQFLKSGQVRYTGRLYCRCGATMSITTNALRAYETALDAFIENHKGEECGDTDPVTCRRNRAKKEREAVRAPNVR
jgi:hypothetical protein